MCIATLNSQQKTDIVKDLYIQSIHPSLLTYLGQSILGFHLKFHLKWPRTGAFGSGCFNFQHKGKQTHLFYFLTTGLGLGVYTLPGFIPLEDLCLLESKTSGLGSTVDLTGSITDGVGM